MDNDSIRSSGSGGDTLVEIWIDGKLRSISVSRGAIEGFLDLSPDQAKGMSADDRCEFVRSNLPLVMSAVRTRLAETGADSTTVLIEEGQLAGRAAPRPGSERRRSERRKGGDRRKPEPPGPRAEGDRRRTDRRSTNRRRPSRKS